LSEDPELSLELAAALNEKSVSPLISLWRMLVADGLVTPFALIVAMAVAAGALMLEALLFRGLFDIASQLALPSQRLFAGVGLILFVAILLGTDIAIGPSSMIAISKAVQSPTWLIAIIIFTLRAVSHPPGCNLSNQCLN
jgi:hypothetical protein